ncbi:major facilitator superfamily domain-containing protein [Lipomyces kononenkoae]|uniref:Major facilitator superfamily domain-containing protein n=1 Tax=Lipomyces kononenkoae TaxID=34357 RepID=A0ACC3SUF1_LIPKO
MSRLSSDGSEKPTVPAKAYDRTDIIYPSGPKLALLMISIFIGMFLVSLDRLIISTAIPQITNEFDSAGDIGWYGTAYLLSNCAFQLMFGKLYAFFSIKATFLISILLFEAGSALCGAAPNSIAFMLGRTVAGLGAGGILAGVMVVIVYAVPLQKRPKYQGFFGAVFGIASVNGPLIGGALTTNVTWRWCFYLNLPLGAVVMVFDFLLAPSPRKSQDQDSSKGQAAAAQCPGHAGPCARSRLPVSGSAMGLYHWSEGRIITLLVLAVVLLIVFALIQVWRPEQATLPPRIFIQRSIASGFWVSSCLGAHMMLFVYYLPLWFQAIDGISAVGSGIHLLPMVLSLVLTSIATGQLVSRIGYYTPFLIAGVCLTAVGAGLLTTLDIGTEAGKWIGFQIVYGGGLGSCSQAPNMAAQTVLPREDVAIGASLMFFGQQLFGAVFATVGQNVLDTQLANRLAGIPGITPRLIQKHRRHPAPRPRPLQGPRRRPAGLQRLAARLFQVGLILACLSILGALAMEWRTVKKNLPPKKPDAERAAEEGNFSQKDAPAEAEVTRTATQTETRTLEWTGEKTETEQANAKEMAA